MSLNLGEPLPFDVDVLTLWNFQKENKLLGLGSVFSFQIIKLSDKFFSFTHML